MQYGTSGQYRVARAAGWRSARPGWVWPSAESPAHQSTPVARPHPLRLWTVKSKLCEGYVCCDWLRIEPFCCCCSTRNDTMETGDSCFEASKRRSGDAEAPADVKNGGHGITLFASAHAIPLQTTTINNQSIKIAGKSVTPDNDRETICKG